MADLKQIPTREGGAYLGVVLEVSRRGVVGWAMRPDVRVVDALDTALWRRKPALGLVHHSDRSYQYTLAISSSGTGRPMK